ncbi:hypothetical protein ABIC99_002409 [Sphaerotilus sulfidivorans]|nr:cellulose biosynthesis protein BcsD [Sphaerotilus sulfidivorans]NZD46251.1 cellulose synthase [Sphaerotilus sulfidivorans]
MKRPTSDHEYHQQHQCSRQWRPFLFCLGQELAERLGPDGARALMRRLGGAMSRERPLPALELLPDLEAAMNALWSDMDWGWVELQDTGDALRIVHHCAPLDAAFGVSARAWSGALLEGAYEQWLKAAGAGDRLRVRQMPGSSSSPDTTLVFVLTS